MKCDSDSVEISVVTVLFSAHVKLLGDFINIFILLLLGDI